ncbi:hypothetical protein CDL15_Pgr023465 [Punica granatum]|nr:hypothetical protein CDL15_Pgr023465 [Punica granatum]
MSHARPSLQLSASLGVVQAHLSLLVPHLQRTPHTSSGMLARRLPGNTQQEGSLNTKCLESGQQTLLVHSWNFDTEAQPSLRKDLEQLLRQIEHSPTHPPRELLARLHLQLKNGPTSPSAVATN